MADAISKNDEISQEAHESSALKKPSRQAATENRVAEISSLLNSLEDAAGESGLTARPAPPPGLEKKKTTATLLESAKPTPAPAREPRSLFEQKLIDEMHDGVVFVDSQAKICLWNKGAERLTGVDSETAIGQAFAPSLLAMCNHASRRISDEACPVAKALLTNTQLRQRLLIMGRRGKHIAIDLHAIPVHAADESVKGATVLLHDAQPEATLEEKCDALYAEVTKDPMTKVANRAEFDRMHALFIEAHEQAKQSCSLIMIDIDHFKKINDTFGHQAGDEAIIAMANLLSSKCRSGDLVARYGGEEFVVLCADCGIADAASRAEQIRKKLSETQHACLGNQRITASFGVTELQTRDTSESMLRRADQALLKAKDQGRNQVVQLGNGMKTKKTKKKWWPFGRKASRILVESTLTTKVPVDIAIEKLRGFVTDHKAKIISTDESSVALEVSSETVSYDRRKADRHVTFRVELQFHEDRVESTNKLGLASGEQVQTRVEIAIRPKRSSRRRKAEQAERARLILQCIKAYFMAKEGEEVEAELVAAGEN
ncbi:MAG: diguanylate cyclase [Planctomycetes bacterium]|nr:diguanylate cyclase [Planctomycetota bacterium]